MFEIEENGQEKKMGASIKVIGVGGGGCNAVNTMIKAGLAGVEYIVANTDAQALSVSMAPTKIQLGAEITKGLGAGANPEVGRKAALDEYEKLSEVLEGADMVFITAGMGGGTGTGAAPVIAKLAKELGALTVGVVTKPFLFEGKKRFRQADAGIAVLEENVDSLITIPNQRLLYLAGESLSLVDTFKKADEVLLNAVRGISDLINTTGQINADFADVSTVMCEKGLALMGTGFCSGPDRAIKAATEAISSPLLEDITIDGATGIIINITGNADLTMHEVNEAVTLIMEAADEEAEIIFGSVIDDSIEDDNIKITVIATGLGGQERVRVGSLKKSETLIPERRPERPQLDQVELRAEKETEVVPRGMEEQNTESNWTPQAQASDDVTNERVDERRESSLAQSIKDAASRYEASKTTSNTEKATPARKEERRESSFSQNSSGRAKSIAEKLGFINFDEDELDTPSYLRKDEAKPHQRNDSENSNRSRPLEL
jgi:cell division protein FtsZ